MTQVRVLAFGVLKDRLGQDSFAMTVPDRATVADLLTQLGETQPGVILKGIAVSVNAEYATAAHLLRDGDEVGLLPPVSGGNLDLEPVRIALVRERMDAAALADAVKDGADGAVVVFDGIVRNHSRGRKTLLLDYEAYEEMAQRQMTALAQDALTRFGVRHVTIVHRLGRLQIGETSVLIVVASAHRAQAFDACRWVIDTLKKTVPIWKKETFVDGAVWTDGEPFPPAIQVEVPDAR